jgi:hypothetical protein
MAKKKCSTWNTVNTILYVRARGDTALLSKRPKKFGLRRVPNTPRKILRGLTATQDDVK